jgi:transcription elongation factor GreA
MTNKVYHWRLWRVSNSLLPPVPVVPEGLAGPHLTVRSCSMANPISREGYDKLTEEIRKLEEDVMPVIVEAIAEARAEGDLKENTEYHGQREAQGMTQAKINQLKTKLAACEIVDKSSLPKGIVTFGSTVTVKDLDMGDLETYEFVGPGEEDYTGDVMKILTSSPLASALAGKKVGDQVEVEVPRGTLKLEVAEIVDCE